jgi:hypothetical protein
VGIALPSLCNPAQYSTCVVPACLNACRVPRVHAQICDCRRTFTAAQSALHPKLRDANVRNVVRVGSEFTTPGLVKSTPATTSVSEKAERQEEQERKEQGMPIRDQKDHRTNHQREHENTYHVGTRRHSGRAPT